MNKKKLIKCVAIRVDFGEIIGYGHIFRANYLANYLLKNNINFSEFDFKKDKTII